MLHFFKNFQKNIGHFLPYNHRLSRYMSAYSVIIPLCRVSTFIHLAFQLSGSTYVHSLRRSDKPPSKIPSLANTSPEKYANHESLTSRGWYYPRVVAGKSPVLHELTLGWGRLAEEINEVGSDLALPG